MGKVDSLDLGVFVNPRLGAAWTAVGDGDPVIFPGGRGLRGRRFFGDNLDARLRQARDDTP